MKKQILILGILLVASLVFVGAGCVPSKSEPKTLPEEQAPAAETARPEEEGEAIELDITKEDLDELKSEIEGMDYEDLNAPAE